MDFTNIKSKLSSEISKYGDNITLIKSGGTQIKTKALATSIKSTDESDQSLTISERAYYLPANIKAKPEVGDDIQFDGHLKTIKDVKEYALGKIILAYSVRTME